MTTNSWSLDAARKNVRVHIAEGYYTLVRMARKSMPFKVIELSHCDFLYFKSFSQHMVQNKSKREKQYIGRKSNGCAT